MSVMSRGRHATRARVHHHLPSKNSIRPRVGGVTVRPSSLHTRRLCGAPNLSAKVVEQFYHKAGPRPTRTFSPIYSTGPDKKTSRRTHLWRLVLSESGRCYLTLTTLTSILVTLESVHAHSQVYDYPA